MRRTIDQTVRIPALRFLPLLLGAALLAPAGAAAQQDSAQWRDRDRDNCICLGDAPVDFSGMSFFRGGRARIGVYLGEATQVDGRTGVEVMEVVDDGPADEAGLMDGDVITSINGSELGDDPGDALVEALADVEPGDTVSLTYYRDGDRHTADVVTDDGGMFTLVSPGSGTFSLRSAPRLGMAYMEGMGDRAGVITPRVLLRRITSDGLDLTEINPALGEYFGTDEGVLVLDIDDDSALGLQPGDVILTIDGRDATDPAHVRAILSSYRDDENITFGVLRHQREIEVTGHVR